jgi:hypothetical protein
LSPREDIKKGEKKGRQKKSAGWTEEEEVTRQGVKVRQKEGERRQVGGRFGEDSGKIALNMHIILVQDLLLYTLFLTLHNQLGLKRGDCGDPGCTPALPPPLINRVQWRGHVEATQVLLRLRPSLSVPPRESPSPAKAHLCPCYQPSSASGPSA